MFTKYMCTLTIMLISHFCPYLAVQKGLFQVSENRKCPVRLRLSFIRAVTGSSNVTSVGRTVGLHLHLFGFPNFIGPG